MIKTSTVKFDVVCIHDLILFLILSQMGPWVVVTRGEATNSKGTLVSLQGSNSYFKSKAAIPILV